MSRMGKKCDEWEIGNDERGWDTFLIELISRTSVFCFGYVLFCIYALFYEVADGYQGASFFFASGSFLFLQRCEHGKMNQAFADFLMMVAEIDLFHLLVKKHDGKVSSRIDFKALRNYILRYVKEYCQRNISELYPLTAEDITQESFKKMLLDGGWEGLDEPELYNVLKSHARIFIRLTLAKNNWTIKSAQARKYIVFQNQPKSDESYCDMHFDMSSLLALLEESNPRAHRVLIARVLEGVKIYELAEEMQVCTRTIIRDMEYVEEFLRLHWGHEDPFLGTY